jgi:3-deoxy-D-manno-octulosonate 8-phosphate phosphatase (KDO 8-P phosphatase)
MSNIKEDLGQVKAFVFDVDGVLSTCKAFLYPSGEMMRSMNIKDGYALQYAVKKGYIIGIISGGDSESVRTRFMKLGIQDIYLKSHDKKIDFADFLLKHQLKASDILYMGDDLPDYEVMQEAGFPACPSDAAEEIKSVSKYISHKEGGDGCVRDVIEQVLRLQGNWFHKDALGW